MKNKAQKIAAIVFIIVIGINLLTINKSFAIKPQDITGIGTLLFSTYIVPFELLSVLLVASIIGVMYIVGDDEK
ncbi:NADH-quinone oxidoreductase subunit J [Ferroplasma acidiphilum]|uniref:Short chain dehydrogenase n=1 Tax=Ferroplasma acidiphilum TaxID=74969 RepID=A0A7K4FMA1_9ARCH|nr:NADH-quinone oxidoreductase subunit J [Ferroplasma acidiphilum]NOL60136.1 short chain dehydrogenase [Ferroplasma acidiphilum]WMT53468.1 MAG: NADH-quinone oxidoreductase subunit J [Ferroplasma acidiphilum]